MKLTPEQLIERIKKNETFIADVKGIEDGSLADPGEMDEEETTFYVSIYLGWLIGSKNNPEDLKDIIESVNSNES